METIVKPIGHALFTTPVREEVIMMKELIAKNPKQLDICLRLLYAEKIGFKVHVHETEKRKIYYGIELNTDEETHAAIEEKYRILTL